MISPVTELPSAVPTNPSVGKRLGLSPSGVSRIRTGSRLPSLRVIEQVAEEYGWTVQEQVQARLAGAYAREFEKRVMSFVSTE